MNGGYGTTIKIYESGLMQPRSISHGGIEGAAVDVTHLQSANALEQYLRGSKDPGHIAATCVFDPEFHEFIMDCCADPAAVLGNVVVTFPDTSVFSCSGFVSHARPYPGSADDAIMFDVEFELSGPPSVTLG